LPVEVTGQQGSYDEETGSSGKGKKGRKRFPASGDTGGKPGKKGRGVTWGENLNDFSN